MPPISKTDGGGEDVPDEVVEALYNQRRRAVVRTLRDSNDGLTLVTLASNLAAETDTPLPDLVIEFHDVHFPKLEECGLIDYDAYTGEVSLDLPTEVVTTALAHARNTNS